MDTFNQREEGFERAFSHNEELRFKARARANLKLGEWAGQTLGLEGEKLADYARALVERGVGGVGDETFVAELEQALAPHGVSAHRIRRRLAEFEAAAMAELQSGR
jgi:hypothetical protein